MMGGVGATALTPDGPPIFDATPDMDIASMSLKLIVIY
jgi:hypothetical protein